MKNFTYIFLAVLVLAACRKADLKAPIGAKPCIDTLQHDIVSVSGPTSASVNEEVAFNLSWRGLNSCDTFSSFKQDTAGNTINIKAYATYDSCSICEMTTNIYQTRAYRFKAVSAGTYCLKFYKANNAAAPAIIDTLVVK